MALITRFKKFNINKFVKSWPSDVHDSHYMRFGMMEFRDRKSVGFNAGASREEYQRGELSERTLGVVNLYMPHQIQVNYGQGWELSSNKLAGSAIQSLNNSELGDNGESQGSAKRSLELVSDLVKVAVRTGSQYGGDINKLLRNVVNPFKEPTYSGPTLRSFRFNWVLVPQTEADCDVIQSIIESFKFHTSPNLSIDGQRYSFPGEFQVSFHSANTIDNKYLPKIGVCVCNGLNVNYTSAGIWSAFRNGHPVEVELSLEFQEIEIVTQEKVLEGY